MTASDGLGPKQRNRNFEETHLLLIEKASELISESGANGVSVSALARVTGINRSTIYYHFDAREDLMSAAQKGSSERLSSDADTAVSRWVDVDRISSFFQREPEVLAIWIENYIAKAEIRERFPQWDSLVAQIGDAFAKLAADEPCHSEIFCALMLDSASKIPDSFTTSAHPFDSLERVLERVIPKHQHSLQSSEAW